MIKAYLAGPLTGTTREQQERNVWIALDAQAKLEDAGFAVYCPHLRHYLDLRHPRTYEHHMRQDEVWIAQCDVFVRMPGPSNGTDREEAYALNLGLAVYTVEEAIRDLGRTAA